MLTSDFQYDLPDSAIAQVAIEPRDAARLLVVPELTDHRFTDLPALLEPGDLVVANRTRVRAARLIGRRRDTGGSIELLLTRPSQRDGTWEALARPSRRLRTGVVIEMPGLEATIERDPEDGVVLVRLTSQVDLEHAIARAGTVPLPPYFRGSLPDTERYQTIFSSSLGSAAAPTAALHFTPRVVEAMTARSIDIAFVELDVGLDTFRPISAPTIDQHTMHTERFLVPEETAAAVERSRSRGSRVVAIGTTVVRTLESAARDDGTVAPGEGTASLFITPGHRFRAVDAMITNFHAPGTTLIVMIAAALGPEWRSVYSAALARGYRFLSFGDAMYIRDVRTLADG